ncbi:hypothetical protein C8R47DRAFT_1223171 [Mycena vitilis]|nr:hypothetical protein C8R47DRAFT_1223171 [Mycena vitilis]
MKFELRRRGDTASANMREFRLLYPWTSHATDIVTERYPPFLTRSFVCYTSVFTVDAKRASLVECAASVTQLTRNSMSKSAPADVSTRAWCCTRHATWELEQTKDLSLQRLELAVNAQPERQPTILDPGYPV